jgi:CIC family chloride channel protein
MSNIDNRLTNNSIWPPTLDVGKLAGLGLLIGLSGAILANAFVASIQWLNDLLLISPRSRMMETDQMLLTVATIAVPTLGGLVVGCLHRLLTERRAHSPADVIAAVQTRHARLPMRPAVVSGLSSLVSLGSGASVGQYGPLVHLGGSLGSVWARCFRMDITVDNIAIACGVAAAISTVFNAPIAGILFAHEVILRHFALRAFAPVALASVLGYVAANAILPQPPLFQIEAAEIRHLWEFGLFLILGVASALLAVGYMRSILIAGQLAARIRCPSVCKPAVAGAGLGLAALWVPEIMGTGSETLRFAFIPGAFSFSELILILLLKCLATAWCLGMGFAGGVFSPALVVGSLFGALFATLLGLIVGDTVVMSDLVVYAVCGMVAVTAPVIGAPLTTVVIVFELTGNYQLTIAALASVALANLVASQLLGRSLFDQQLLNRGLDLSAGRSKALLASRSVAPLISDRYVALPVDVSVAAACAAMGKAASADAYLVDAAGRYQGTIRLQALTARHGEQMARAWQAQPDFAIRADASLWETMYSLRYFVGEGVPVIDDDNRLIGTVFESDLIRNYLDILDEMRQEEYATR